MVRKHQCGTTLLELLIALVIVAVLLLGFNNSYRVYQQHSERALARAQLYRFAQLQERYYLRHNRYAASLTILGAAPKQHTGATDAYSYGMAITGNDAFTATAHYRGHRRRNNPCLTLRLRETGAQTALPGPVSRCW